MNESLTVINNGVVAYSITEAEIDKLAEEFSEVPSDLTVKANYEICRKATSTIRGLRGDVEKRRKELKADALEWGKKVDGAAKEITARLLAIEEPFAIAKKDFDTAAEIAKREAVLAEERRVDMIAERIANIKAQVTAAISFPSSKISEMLEEIAKNNLPADAWAMEFSDKASAVITDTLEKLQELREMKEGQELAAARQAEDELQRKAEAEQRRKEEDLARAQRDAELAEERKKLDAERKVMAEEQAVVDARMAQERAEFEEEKRVQMAKVYADAAKAKAEKEEKELAELAAKNKEAEKEDRKKLETGTDAVSETCYKLTANSMLKIIGDKQKTKTLLDAIINGNIPNVNFLGV